MSRGMERGSGDTTANIQIDAKRIGGIKRLKHLLPLLTPLHEVGCERDHAGNRRLHFDEYVTLVLLCLTNPLIGSVRALQQASQIEKVAESDSPHSAKPLKGPSSGALQLRVEPLPTSRPPVAA